MGRHVNKFTKIYQKLMFLCISFILTPFFYIFELSVVRPVVVEMYQMKPTIQALHVLFSIFLFTNVYGNMLMSVMVDVAVGDRDGKRYCEECKKKRPEKSWHCGTCNTCVWKRNHHCTFFSKCVGINNQRYYLLYLFYLTFSLFYSTYHNYYFVSAKFGRNELMLSAFRIINPFLRVMVPEPMGVKEGYVLFLFGTMGLLFWSTCLFSFHLNNAVKGVAARDHMNKELFQYSKWKENLLNIFGEKWYLAVLWPFVNSALPENMKIH